MLLPRLRNLSLGKENSIAYVSLRYECSKCVLGVSIDMFVIDLVMFSVQGLKTGMYYLRTRAAADAIKFTVDTTVLNNVCVFLFLVSLDHVQLFHKSVSFIVHPVEGTKSTLRMETIKANMERSRKSSMVSLLTIYFLSICFFFFQSFHFRELICSFT
jgi:hypothetical protein